MICSACSLIYASPRQTCAVLDDLNLNNPGDPGSQVNAPAGVRRAQGIRFEELQAANHVQLMKRFMDLKGKRILGLRCRSGALAALLRQEGAAELGIDPQEASINYARQVRGLADTRIVPMSRLDRLEVPGASVFDAIEGLNDHVAAHVLCPRFLLTRAFELLKPGGFLFLDEKDVLLPSRRLHVLDTGQAHQYHFTMTTLTGLIRSVGFEIRECELDRLHVTDFQHFVVVAQKPESGMPPRHDLRFVPDRAAAKDVRRRLRKLELSYQWIRCHEALVSGVRGFLRRVPGLRQGRRLVQRMLSH